MENLVPQIDEFDPLQEVVAEKKRIAKPKVSLEQLKDPLLNLQHHVDLPYDGIQYIKELLKVNQEFAHNVYPGMRFEDFLLDVNKVCGSKEWKSWHFAQIREDMGILANQQDIEDIGTDELEELDKFVVDDKKNQSSENKEYLIQYDELDTKSQGSEKSVEMLPLQKMEIESDVEMPNAEDEEKEKKLKRKQALELLRKRRTEE
eukprot:NODE_271_length_11194_cov_0.541595.p7 type:complete len:204 gc:universal NODE_271_length_11194_cov_0.541595:2146-2757(+)